MLIKPEQLIIPEEKVLGYLLVKKDKNDKSEFLARLGFTKDNYKELIAEIIVIATTH